MELQPLFQALSSRLKQEENLEVRSVLAEPGYGPKMVKKTEAKLGFAFPKAIAAFYAEYLLLNIDYVCRQENRTFIPVFSIHDLGVIGLMSANLEEISVPYVRELVQNHGFVLESHRGHYVVVDMKEEGYAIRICFPDGSLLDFSGDLETYIRRAIRYAGAALWQAMFCTGAHLDEIKGIFGEDILLGESLGRGIGSEVEASVPNSSEVIAWANINTQNGRAELFRNTFSSRKNKRKYVQKVLNEGAGIIEVNQLNVLSDWYLPKDMFAFFLALGGAEVIFSEGDGVKVSFKIPRVFKMAEGTLAFFGFQPKDYPHLENTFPFLIDENGYIIWRAVEGGIQFSLLLELEQERKLEATFGEIVDALIENEGKDAWQRNLK